MKHKIVDDVSVDLNVDLPVAELEQLIEKVTDSALIIITALTVSHILKKKF